MKDSSISKYHLFSGVSVMVIAYLTITTVVLYLKCFKLYVPDFLDALRTQGMSDIVAALRGLFSFFVSVFWGVISDAGRRSAQSSVQTADLYPLSGNPGIGHRRGNDQAVLDLYQQAKNPTEVSAQDQPDLQFRPA